MAAVLAGAGFFYARPAVLWAAEALLVCGLLFPRAAARVSRAWLGFSGLLGELNSRLALTLIFFFVLTPAALLRRLFSGVPRGFGKKTAGSFFFERNKEYSSGDFEKLW